MRCGVLLLLLAAVVAGCGRTTPAPVTRGGGYAAPVPPSRPASVAAAPGEPLFAIARRWQVPIRAIIEANNLSPPYTLQPGQVLVLPDVRTHTVQRGDTLYAISRRYGVDAAALARVNELPAPFNVRLGEVLILPGRVEGEAPVTAAAAPPPQSSPARESVKVAVLPPPNLGEPEAPALRTEPAPAPPAPPPTPDPPPAVSEPPSGKGLSWPVRGRILVAFGPASGGTHNDGINIAAPVGTPVVAADDGTVAYVGNELRGFGNLVLLKHADGWLSAYAHCERVMVRKGERVRRGQTIARVGATGSVAEPQLHFELRQGTRAVDPIQHLRAAQASR
jgi:murein DD-endopeptidase MepM/ murein hydrolase activator NlpD